MATEESMEVFTLRCVRESLIVDYKFWSAELRDSSKLRQDMARGDRDRTGYLGLALEQRLTAGHLAANNCRDLIRMIDLCLVDETELEELPAVSTVFIEPYSPPRGDYPSPTQKLVLEEDPRFWAEKDGRA